ncbi:hypothetical protein CTheo_7416 [Ceratobasidium theobromae]|uniref:Cyanovirin-N domain-containing protein n=1 Tax=Ceratobasidium theobromae TaxID=1582974 RepID=A0A5N5QBV0_9AGAM|nr:hypothetical protein CTheo_7416 [Ceratobasidium theobromae]
MVLTNHSALAPHRFPASDPLLPLDPAMRFTSILTLAAASAITTVQAAGNFGASCKDIATLVGGTDLVASCRKSNGSYVYAQLDMNKCVANYGGHLACASKWWELWKIVFRLWNQQRYYHSRVHVQAWFEQYHD